MVRGARSSRASPARSSCSSGPGCGSSRSSSEVTGHAVPVFQRVDQAGFRCRSTSGCSPTATRCSLFGLDHTVTEQRPSPAEIEAVRAFLRREGTCLVIGPHHDVGASPELDRARRWSTASRRRAGAAPAALRRLHARAHAGARHPGRESLRAASGGDAGHQSHRAADRRARPRRRAAGWRACTTSTSTCTCRTTR